MGKKSSADDAAGQAAQAQAKLANQLVSETAPIRRNLIGDANQFLQGGHDVTQLPEFAAFKGSSEAQFGRARDNIIANTPEGGGLSSALGNLELGRAGNQANFTGALAGDEVNRALQLATFGTAQGSAGLAGASATAAGRAQAEAAQNAGKASGAGQAAGSAAALKALAS